MVAYRAIEGLKIAFAVVAALGAGLLTGSVLLGWGVARLHSRSAEAGRGAVGEPPAWLTLHWIGVPAGLIVAVLVRDPLLSIWVFFLLAWLGHRWDVHRQRRRRDREALQTTRELLRLLHNYLQGSLAGAFERSIERLEVEGDLGEALEQLIVDYNRGVTWERVLGYLRGFGPSVERLVLLLGAAPSMGEGEVVPHLERLASALERSSVLRADLEGRLGRWRDLLDLLAGAAGMGVLVCLLLSPWREFYVSTLEQRVLLILGASLSALTYTICSEELALLEVG